MKIVFAGLVAASTLTIAASASAQGVSVGPGIGIAGSVDPYSGSRSHSYEYRDGAVHQGRSVYRDRAVRGRTHRDGYDRYDDDNGDLDGF